MKFKDLAFILPPLSQSELPISFIVIGRPVAKARPRFVAGAKKPFTKKTTKKYEGMVRGKALDLMTSMGRSPSVGELSIKIDMYFNNRASLPDIDNVAKAVLDAMNGIIYMDDSQVMELICKKIVKCKKDGFPHIKVEISNAMQGM